ncbi:hypothetical protein, partial [Alcanivorax sp.]|uniref:hypothetical protein n=1 Tax=Alcanivorax sp. TaxID=1872427 RepID=UPI0032D9597A
YSSSVVSVNDNNLTSSLIPPAEAWRDNKTSNVKNTIFMTYNASITGQRAVVVIYVNEAAA